MSDKKSARDIMVRALQITLGVVVVVLMIVFSVKISLNIISHATRGVIADALVPIQAELQQQNRALRDDLRLGWSQHSRTQNLGRRLKRIDENLERLLKRFRVEPAPQPTLVPLLAPPRDVDKGVDNEPVPAK